MGEAQARVNLGMAYCDKGEPEKGLECFRKGLPVLHDKGNKLWEARTLAALAPLLPESEERDKAWRQASIIFQQLGLSDLLNDNESPGSWDDQPRLRSI